MICIIRICTQIYGPASAVVAVVDVCLQFAAVPGVENSLLSGACLRSRNVKRSTSDLYDCHTYSSSRYQGQ